MIGHETKRHIIDHEKRQELEDIYRHLIVFGLVLCLWSLKNRDEREIVFSGNELGICQILLIVKEFLE